MKNTNKGFTLVELIVVITILAILGTIAFISLQGYSQDAKNSKVTSDLSQLSSKINIAISSKDNVTLASVGDNTKASTNNVSWTWAGISLSDSEATYKVGSIDFAVLKENGANFQDPEGNDYIVWTLSKGSTAVFTLAGQTKDSAWNYKAVIKGSYYKASSSDVNSLVSESWATTPLTNGASISNSLY